MGRSLEGKVALVTGASQGGTGTAVATRFAAEGAKVAIVARNEAGLRDTLAAIEAVGRHRSGAPGRPRRPRGAAWR